jgi:hypothetical protein|tara:strand:+ start:104 stop:364 length:261 start_codon:yes stop_codon:yes gene_type:complete
MVFVFLSSQSFCHILGVPTIGVPTESNAFASQTLFCDVDMMCLAWIAFGFEWIGHPHKWMSLKIYTINFNVSGLEFDVFVHIACSE